MADRKVQTQVRKYAKYIGVDIDTYPELFSLMEEGFKCPVAAPWEVRRDQSGGHYFFNRESGVTSQQHPMDDHYRRKAEEHIAVLGRRDKPPLHASHSAASPPASGRGFPSPPASSRSLEAPSTPRSPRTAAPPSTSYAPHSPALATPPPSAPRSAVPTAASVLPPATPAQSGLGPFLLTEAVRAAFFVVLLWGTLLVAGFTVAPVAPSCPVPAVPAPAVAPAAPVVVETAEPVAAPKAKAKAEAARAAKSAKSEEDEEEEEGSDSWF